MKKTVPKKIDVGVYWAPVNDKESPYYNPKEKKGKVYFDVESMQEEFSIKMKKLIKDHGSKQCIKDWEDEV